MKEDLYMLRMSRFIKRIRNGVKEKWLKWMMLRQYRKLSGRPSDFLALQYLAKSEDEYEEILNKIRYATAEARDFKKICLTAGCSVQKLNEIEYKTSKDFHLLREFVLNLP